MTSLAIETSGRLGSVALCDDGVILDERTFAHGLQHAAELIPLIDVMTKDRGIVAKQIGEVYVSAGPGSFTGLRIGITLAKTLSLATGAKIVAVPTVKVLAENAPTDTENLIIVLDAKRGQIFTARFRRENHAWIEDETAHLDTLVEMLARSPRPVHLLGEGIPYHRDAIGDAFDVHITDENCWRARASAVARLGIAMAQHAENLPIPIV